MQHIFGTTTISPHFLVENILWVMDMNIALLESHEKAKIAKSGDLAGQEIPPYLNKTCLGNKSLMAFFASLATRTVAPSH